MKQALRIPVRTILAAGALALAGIFAALAYGAVSAQADTPTPQASPDAVTPSQPPAMPGGWRDGDNGAALAAALGIPQTELQQAVTAARAAALQQAVADGLITQQQADQIAASGRGQWFGARGFDAQIDYHAFLADALGITVEELQSAIRQAASAALDAAVAEGRITQQHADLMKARQALAQDETFRSSLQTAYEAALAQAVDRGVITQAQADALLAQGAPWGKLGGGMFGFERGGRGSGGMRGRGMSPGAFCSAGC